jgi:hypothetical protein
MNIFELAYIDDHDYVKYIFSSADYYPGFYRFTMGDRNNEEGQLSCKGLLKAYFNQEFSGSVYTHEDFTYFTLKKHNSLRQRNLSRSDMAVYDILDVKYKEWQVSDVNYDIALLEIDNTSDVLELGITYFFMGSLIRFNRDSIYLNYNLLTSSYQSKLMFDNPIEYASEMFKESIKEFFFPADIVASIDNGNITMNSETTSRLLTCHTNSLVIASNSQRSSELPIRWAKDILLGEVV